MSFLVSDVTAAAQGMFNDLTATNVLRLFNAAHAKICRYVKLYEDDYVPLPMVSGVRNQALDNNILRVWSAYLYSSSSSFLQLEEFHVDQADYQEKGWRGDSPGSPWRWFVEGPNFGLDPTPNISTPTLAISGATNASPIVVTSAAQSLAAAADGLPANAIAVSGVLGNTSANGSWYGKRTGYSATTLGLYQDLAQTIPVAGNSGYTSGGILTTSASYPVVILNCQKRRVLTLTDSMPGQIDYFDAWTDEIAFLWASHRHRDQAEALNRQAKRSLNRLSLKIMGRPVRLKPETVMNVPLIRH